MRLVVCLWGMGPALRTRYTRHASFGREGRGAASRPLIPIILRTTGVQVYDLLCPSSSSSFKLFVGQGVRHRPLWCIVCTRDMCVCVRPWRVSSQCAVNSTARQVPLEILMGLADDLPGGVPLRRACDEYLFPG